MLEEYDAMSDRELTEKVWMLTPQNPAAVSIDRLLRIRASEREAEGAHALVAATKDLVAATKRLGTVTWWLVAGTLLMGLAAGTDVVLRLIKGMHG